MLLRPTTLVSSAACFLPFSDLPHPPSPPCFLPALRSSRFALQLPVDTRLHARALISRSAKRLGDAENVHGVEQEEVAAEARGWEGVTEEGRMSVAIGSASFPARLGMARMSLGDQAFFLLAFIAVTTSLAFTSLVIAAIPTLFAMKRAATSLAKLADTAHGELPSTMAAIRLSGMEISDLTLELSDLSQEITDGVSKSAQAVQAAEAGIRQMSAIAKQHTISMIQERASLPTISIQPMVAGAARTTSRAVGQAKKTFMNLLSHREYNEQETDGEES